MPKVKAEKKSRQHQEVKTQGQCVCVWTLESAVCVNSADRGCVSSHLGVIMKCISDV